MADPITFHRRSNGTTETLVLVAPGYSLTIELTVRGLELDATTLEKLLHAPMSLLANERL
jgi:hypothetical protein